MMPIEIPGWKAIEKRAGSGTNIDMPGIVL
jgi:hypothetical protein